MNWMTVRILTQARVVITIMSITKKKNWGKEKLCHLLKAAEQTLISGSDSKQQWCSVLPPYLFNIKNNTKFPPVDSILLAPQSQEIANQLVPDEPHLEPKVPLKPPGGQRGVKEISFWVGITGADGADSRIPWIPPGNKAWKTGEQCSWQQTRVKMKSILSCQLTPLLQFNKCIIVEFAATDMPVMVQNPFCCSPNSVSQNWQGRI